MCSRQCSARRDWTKEKWMGTLKGRERSKVAAGQSRRSNILVTEKGNCFQERGKAGWSGYVAVSPYCFQPLPPQLSQGKNWYPTRPCAPNPSLICMNYANDLITCEGAGVGGGLRRAQFEPPLLSRHSFSLSRKGKMKGVGGPPLMLAGCALLLEYRPWLGAGRRESENGGRGVGGVRWGNPCAPFFPARNTALLSSAV